MNIRTGCDIVHLPTFVKRVEGRPGLLARVFTNTELADDRLPHLAGIFAAKEAVLKAVGWQPDVWKQVEIRKRASGEPYAEFVGEVGAGVGHCHLSISHEQDYAMAVAVAILKEDDRFKDR